MSRIKAGIRSWETTIIGMVLAGLQVLQNYNNGELSFDNWRSWAIPALIAMGGVLVRDADKSSEASGLK